MNSFVDTVIYIHKHQTMIWFIDKVSSFHEHHIMNLFIDTVIFVSQTSNYEFINWHCYLHFTNITLWIDLLIKLFTFHKHHIINSFIDTVILIPQTSQ